MYRVSSCLPKAFAADEVNEASHLEREVFKSDSDGREIVVDDLEWTQEEETRIRHKIDWHAVPLVTWLYMLCVSPSQDLGESEN